MSDHCSLFMPPSFAKEKGFSLVELMVALVIGLLVVLGVGQVFVSSKQSYNRMEDLAGRQESLRVISDLVSLDIRTSTSIADNNGDQSVIDLTYGNGVRESDPYCAGTDELQTISYEFSGQALQVEVKCESWSDPVIDSMVDGIESVQFALDSPGALDDGLFVKVDVTFPPKVPGESVENRRFSFMVARRKNILH